MALARRSLFAAALLAAAPASAVAQLIPVRVIPVADADQFGFFPAANFGMAGVSVALPDSLLDPFENPALAARVKRGRYFGGPTFFAVTNDAGSGQTLPIGAIARAGRWFAGATMAVQEIDPAGARQDNQIISPLASTAPGPPFASEANQTQSNRYAHGMMGYALRPGLAVAASGLWSDLRAMEGVELLFTGSRSVRQRGEHRELRVGALKQWGARSLEMVALRGEQDMRYDVGYTEVYWDPASRQQRVQTIETRGISGRSTNGVHMRYGMPLRDTAWRVGAVATANLIHESRAPYHEFMGIPRDPSATRAFNLGMGLSRRRGLVTVALDAIAEPAWRRATGPADTSVSARASETNREESFFKFRNAIVRSGVSRDFVMSDSDSRLRLQAGMQVRAVNYALEQHDFLRGTFRARSESWREWTHAWGANFTFSRFEFGYHLRVLSGMGRLGVPPDDGTILVERFGTPVPASVTLYPVRVTSHQMYLTVPLR